MNFLLVERENSDSVVTEYIFPLPIVNRTYDKAQILGHFLAGTGWDGSATGQSGPVGCCFSSVRTLERFSHKLLRTSFTWSIADAVDIL